MSLFLIGDWNKKGVFWLCGFHMTVSGKRKTINDKNSLQNLNLQ